MYQVQIYHLGELVNQFEFGSVRRAFNCFIEHADSKQLNIAEDGKYAYDNERFPEVEVKLIEL